MRSGCVWIVVRSESAIHTSDVPDTQSGAGPSPDLLLLPPLPLPNLYGGVMCAEGMVCIATFALAMIFTLPDAPRQQKLTIWLVRRGSQ